MVVCAVSIFIRFDHLDQSDFLLIAWYPAQQLLSSVAVDANYPYPLWTALIFLPLSAWAKEVAVALVYLCNLLALSAALTLFLLIFERAIAPLTLALSVSLSVFFLPTLSSLWLGQITIFSLLALALIVYFYRREKWTALGVALALSFLKPQMMLALVGLLILWALTQKKWRVLIGFGATMTFFVLISLPFAASPMQIVGGGIGAHLGGYILETSTLWGATMSLGISWIVPALISLALLLWLFWLWLPALRGKSAPNFFLFSLAIIINLVVVPYSWMHNLILLLFPFGYFASALSRSAKKKRIVGLTILFALAYPLMYALFLSVGMTQNTQAYQIIPALILLPTAFWIEKNSTPRSPLSTA